MPHVVLSQKLQEQCRRRLFALYAPANHAESFFAAVPIEQHAFENAKILATLDAELGEQFLGRLDKPIQHEYGRQDDATFNAVTFQERQSRGGDGKLATRF